MPERASASEFLNRPESGSNAPLIRVNRNVNVGSFLDWNRRHLLARFRGDGESQRNHIVATCHPSKRPNDGVQPHRLLNQGGKSFKRPHNAIGKN